VETINSQSHSQNREYFSRFRQEKEEEFLSQGINLALAKKLLDLVEGKIKKITALEKENCQLKNELNAEQNVRRQTETERDN